MVREVPCLSRILFGCALAVTAPATAAAATAPPPTESVAAGPICLPGTCPLFPGDRKLAANVVLKLGGSPGQAGEIEVLSWSWVAPVPDVRTSDPQEGGEVARERGKAVRPTLSDMTVVRRVNKSTPMLATAAPPQRGSLTLEIPAGTCVSGARYLAVTLQSGSQAYELRDVTVASCAPGTARKGKKTDKAKLDYMTVKMETVLVSG